MKKNFTSTNKIEKILQKNPLFIILESKVIFKNNNEKVCFYLDQISKVRLIENRDFTHSIVVLVFSALFYLLVLSPFNLNFVFSFLYLIIMSILFVTSFFIKNNTYKLLINNGNFSFNEITISKSNITYAENFIAKF